MNKVVNTIVNILLVIVLIFSATITVMVLTSTFNEERIPSLGNKAVLTIETDSMLGPKGFSTKDVVIIDRLTEEEAQNLQVGQVITFHTSILEYEVLLTHRIVGVYYHGDVRYYVTRGDNTPARDTEYVTAKEIVGVWNNWHTTAADNKEVLNAEPVVTDIDELSAQPEDPNRPLSGPMIKGLGGVLKFLSSQTGFMVCIIVPLALFFIYQLYKLFTMISENKNKAAMAAVEAEKAKIEEMLKAAGKNADGTDASPPTEPLDEEAQKQKIIEEYLAKQKAEKEEEEKKQKIIEEYLASQKAAEKDKEGEDAQAAPKEEPEEKPEEDAGEKSKDDFEPEDEGKKDKKDKKKK
ncbi:MAG: signal peptidase I [Clostridiales bacterium]|nr:signal peptidase I [Clostridiales bacterium]